MFDADGIVLSGSRICASAFATAATSCLSLSISM
jgi:hypothetical protein